MFLKHKAKRPDLFFTVDDFAYRIHTPVSNFHRTHRPNLLIYGHSTASIDIVQSQPTILAKILFNAISENDFSNWINEGKDVYLMLQEKANIPTRDEAKKALFEILFSKPSNKLAQMFGDANWINWINEIKKTPNPENPHFKQKPHSNLAFLLQRTESKMMRKVWDKLVGANIPFLSIHDEIRVISSKINEAEAIVNEVLSNELKTFKISIEPSPQVNDNTTTNTIQIQNKQALKGNIIALLDELIAKIPLNVPVDFLGESIHCFRSIIIIIKEGLTFQPKYEYWKDAVKEIYKIMNENNHKQFIL